MSTLSENHIDFPPHFGCVDCNTGHTSTGDADYIGLRASLYELSDATEHSGRQHSAVGHR